MRPNGRAAWSSSCSATAVPFGFKSKRTCMGTVKKERRRLNTVCGLKEVEKLLIDQFPSITLDKWAHCCKHVEKIEADYWESNRSLELLLGPVIIRDSGSDSESVIVQ